MQLDGMECCFHQLLYQYHLLQEKQDNLANRFRMVQTEQKQSSQWNSNWQEQIFNGFFNFHFWWQHHILVVMLEMILDMLNLSIMNIFSMTYLRTSSRTVPEGSWKLSSSMFPLPIRKSLAKLFAILYFLATLRAIVWSCQPSILLDMLQLPAMMYLALISVPT